MSNKHRLRTSQSNEVVDEEMQPRQHPMLRPGEEFDSSKPPTDIAKHFYRALIPDDMLQQMIETLEDIDSGGMVEGAGLHAALLDFKKLKFLCKGLTNVYFNDNEHRVHEYMQALGAILNVRFRGTTDSKVEATS